MKRLVTTIGVALIASGSFGFGSRGEAGPPRPPQPNPGTVPVPRAPVPEHGPATHPQHHPRQHWSQPYYGRAYRQPYWYYHGYAPYRRPLYQVPYSYYQYPYEYPYSYAPPTLPYPYYAPPLYIPAEEVYGPEAVKRFMGVDRMNAPAADPDDVVPGVERNRDVNAGAGGDGQAGQRATNQEALALAWKFIGFGDAHFANQKYADAFQRYKKAAQAAPGLAQAYFRQGYALTAQERYDLAAKALQRGLALDPGWARSKFRADELYGPNQLAKTAHLDALAKAVEAKPHDVDAVFLMAVFYYFDNNRDRAAPLLRQAAQMLGPEGDCLAGFIEQVQ